MPTSLAQTIIGLRRDAVTIFKTGVDAADPYRAVKRVLFMAEHQLELALSLNDASRRRAEPWSAIHVIAFGKGACAMALAAQESIPASLWAGPGIAVTNYENVRAVDNFKVLGAAHPLPDSAGLDAAQLIARQLQQVKPGELVLVLASGGGSALLPLPVAPISLTEKVATTQLLLNCGATINQINCVRKHLSQIKGGGLARLAAPADLHALILSDVLGDDISAIASGPTVADDSTFTDAIDILKSKGIWHQTPVTVQTVLIRGSKGEIRETPKSRDPVFEHVTHTLVGSNAISLTAITQTAGQLGYETMVFSAHLSGEAKDQAETLVLFAKQHITARAHPVAVLAGGETTVTLKGKGKGGRNQEMALAFALAAERHGLQGSWVFLSGGTDGRDGPTDAAGGMVDNTTVKRLREAGIDPQARLSDNDAYHALQGSQDLLITGATGTNVADLQVLLIDPKQR